MDPRVDKAALYQHRMEGLKHCRSIREFLETYKTRPCTREEPHPPELCQDYHSAQDHRRNPYFNHTFTYYPYHPCGCDNPVPPPAPRNVRTPITTMNTTTTPWCTAARSAPTPSVPPC